MVCILAAIYVFISSAQADSNMSHILDFTTIDIVVQKKLPAKLLDRIHICPPPLLDGRESFILEIYDSIDTL